MSPKHEYIRQQLRRDFLFGCGLGLGGIALQSLQSNAVRADESAETQAANPLAPKKPHFPGKAQAVIQLFMAGGPSQLELFDYKPKLQELNGQVVPKSFVEGKRFAFLKPDAQLLGTKRKFSRHGESGAELSELLPNIAKQADELAIVRNLHTDNFNHGPAKLIATTGFQMFGAPTIGAWVLYGLGCETEDLPGYVVLQSGPRGPRGGAYLWSNGFLPSIYQGVPFRASGDPILNLASPPQVSSAEQKKTVETIAKLNALRFKQAQDAEILTRTANYEMAFRMQMSAPELVDISREAAATLEAYGVKPGEASFAYNCLLARRLVERGVRYVTLFHTEWDHHGGGENLEKNLESTCGQVDKPTAALIEDLKQRGMLDSTLVIWGGEFGRTPMGEVRESTGRDHHIEAFTMFMAGGGVKKGVTLGETDELGFYPTEPDKRTHVHDLHATILNQLGFDHLKHTFRHQGRDYRLTDTAGRVVKELIET